MSKFPKADVLCIKPIRTMTIPKAFESLGIDQLMTLQRYVESGKIAIPFELRDAAVLDLVKRGILYQPPQQLTNRLYSAYYAAEFCVCPEAQDFLRPDRFQALLLRRSARQEASLKAAAQGTTFKK